MMGDFNGKMLGIQWDFFWRNVHLVEAVFRELRNAYFEVNDKICGDWPFFPVHNFFRRTFECSHLLFCLP